MNLPSSINGWRPNRPEPSTPFREAIGSVGYEFRWVIIDTWMLTWRMLIHYRRNPEMLASITISPVMFLLLFNYVFGGAISGGGEFNYLDYLVPGVLIQNNVFTVMQAGVGLADDLQKGVIDRYRSLPMARSSVIGRTHPRHNHSRLPHRIRHPRRRDDHGNAIPRRILARILPPVCRRRLLLRFLLGSQPSQASASNPCKPSRPSPSSSPSH